MGCISNSVPKCFDIIPRIFRSYILPTFYFHYLNVVYLQITTYLVTCMLSTAASAALLILYARLISLKGRYSYCDTRDSKTLLCTHYTTRVGLVVYPRGKRHWKNCMAHTKIEIPQHIIILDTNSTR